MRFVELTIPGAYCIESEPARDERGLFMRLYCRRELESHGLTPTFVQSSLSVNDKKGTLRGLHYQAAPHEEAKLLRCNRGALYAVVLDLRSDSPTFLRWCAVELSPRGASLYVPRGCANGFQTLEDDTEVLYHISEEYHPESACGVRWDDPQIGIVWPEVERRILSPRDASLPDFEQPRPVTPGSPR